MPLTKKTNFAFDTLTACLADVKSWLSKNFLFLNPGKTEVIVFSPSEHGASIQPNLGNLNSFISPHVRNLCVLFDNYLKFDKQISAVVGSSFFHLRSLSKIKPFLSKSSLEVAIHAFITSRLDYCNSSKSQISRLQVVQNSAARFLKGCKKFDHASPLLRSLHWLPVHYRTEFKILLLVFKSLNNQAPSYLSDLLHPYTPARGLRSEGKLLLQTPRTRLKTRGSRAFGWSHPLENLPVHIRMASTLSEFKSYLKTHLFSLAFNM